MRKQDQLGQFSTNVEQDEGNLGNWGKDKNSNKNWMYKLGMHEKALHWACMPYVLLE